MKKNHLLKFKKKLLKYVKNKKWKFRKNYITLKNNKIILNSI